MILMHSEKSKTRIVFLTFAFSIICFWGHLYGAPPKTGDEGKFEFSFKTSGKVRNFDVYFYAPDKLSENSEIVFVLHGVLQIWTTNRILPSHLMLNQQ